MPPGRDLLGLAERSAHADDRTLVLFDPSLPRGHSLAFLCPPLFFRKGRPCRHFRAGLAAEKNGEIGVRAHDLPSPSGCCDLNDARAVNNGFGAIVALKCAGCRQVCFIPTGYMALSPDDVADVA